ncbi:MAG: hypothetical protein LBE08_09305, partial [Bifidobacteriaceae bacterium]|nr:hypothetical protein [Bifidobacteriaceae bacterium]
MTPPDDIKQVWSAAVDSLVNSGRITGSDFGYTALVSPVGLLGETVLLAVASAYTKDHLETKLRGPLTEALSEASGHQVNFAVTVDPALAEQERTAPPAA